MVLERPDQARRQCLPFSKSIEFDFKSATVCGLQLLLFLLSLSLSFWLQKLNATPNFKLAPENS